MQKQPPKGFAKEQRDQLGPMSYEEKAMLAVFSMVALMWVFSGVIPEGIRPSDPSIGVMGAVLMFLIPAKQRRGGLLVWEDMKELPWGILLLFGGGLSLATAFEDSELTPWFRGHLALGRARLLLWTATAYCTRMAPPYGY